MAEQKIINEIPISMYVMKQELDKIKKRDKELNFRAAKTEEYIHQFAKLKNADELAQKIIKLNIPRLKEQQIHKIVDILPTTVADLKVILQSYTVTVNNEGMKKIVEVINKVIKE